MQKGNVICTLRLLTNNMSNGILPLLDETLKLLQTKHPKGKIAKIKALLQGPKKPTHIGPLFKGQPPSPDVNLYILTIST